MPVKKKPKNKNNRKVYEKTLKLGEVFEDPNGCVGAEKTRNWPWQWWFGTIVLPKRHSYFQKSFCSYLGMRVSVTLAKLTQSFYLFIYAYCIFFSQF